MIEAVFVSKAAIKKYHNLRGLTKIYLLTVLESGKSKIKVLDDLVSAESSLSSLHAACLLSPQCALT